MTRGIHNVDWANVLWVCMSWAVMWPVDFGETFLQFLHANLALNCLCHSLMYQNTTPVSQDSTFPFIASVWSESDYFAQAQSRPPTACVFQHGSNQERPSCRDQEIEARLIGSDHLMSLPLEGKLSTKMS